MIYSAFVCSLLSYDVEICGDTYITHLSKWIILNNKILLRILQTAPRYSHVADLYIQYNTLTLPNLHKFNILSYWLSISSFIVLINCPISFYVVKNSDLHNYNTHSKEESHLGLFSTSSGQRSIKYKERQLSIMVLSAW